jgi:hypothetical protein
MKFSKRRLVLGSLIFLAATGLWLFSSDFILSRELDYDPYRYLFNALNGDSASQLGANYRIVDYLRFVGATGLGYYLTHLAVVFFCYQAILGYSIIPKIDFKVLCALVILAFLLVQTGKDGFLSLSLVSLLAWAPRDIASHQDRQIMLYKIFSIFTLIFSSWIRIQSLAYALVAIVIIRLGWKSSCIISVLMALVYSIHALLLIDGPDAQIESFGAESSVPPSFMGVSTFGTGFASFLVRLFFYFSSNVALPFIYILRVLSGQQVPSYIVYVYLIVLVLLLCLCRKPRLCSKFLATLLPFCLFLSAFPIVHFRYLLSVMPFAVIYISASAYSWPGNVVRVGDCELSLQQRFNAPS